MGPHVCDHFYIVIVAMLGVFAILEGVTIWDVCSNAETDYLLDH